MLITDRHEASRSLFATAELFYFTETDDIQDVSARTVGEKVNLFSAGGGSSDRSDPAPPATGLDLLVEVNSVVEIIKFTHM